MNARREFSRSHYFIHPVSVKTLIVLSFSFPRKHVIIDCFLLLCVLLLISMYASVQTKTYMVNMLYFQEKRNL